MSEEAVILHGTPTLTGIKTGSLFRCEYESIEAMRTSLREWIRRFSGKGLRVIPLSFETNKALLYPNHTMWYEHNDFYVIIDEGCDLDGEILYEANLAHKDYGSGMVMLVAMGRKPGKEISLNQFLRKIDNLLEDYEAYYEVVNWEDCMRTEKLLAEVEG